MDEDRENVDVGQTETSALHEKLDSLWICYLRLLDEYQRAQAQLTEHFSSGFFSLARANFKSPMAGRGRRYGQDYYDERMKASTTANLSSDNSSNSDLISDRMNKLTLHVMPMNRFASFKLEAPPPEKKGAAQQPSPPLTPGRDDAVQATEQTAKDDPTKEHSAEPSDPLRWFGVLVPTELRATQSSFKASLGSAEVAVNAARGLRLVETDIRKTRKAIRKAEKAAVSAR